MAIVDKFDTTANFWESNPQLKAAGPFMDLYEADTSRKKEKSSKIMWCISLIWDRKSKYFGLHINEKQSLIFKDFLKDEHWPEANEEDYKALSDFYIKLSDTPAMRSLRETEDKLDERATFLQTTPYTLGEKGDRGYLYGTADLLDKMLANSTKIYENYEKAMATVAQEEAEGVAIGKATQSLSDTGDI